MSHPCCICGKPAMGPYGEKSHCSACRPSSGLPLLKLSAAREYLVAGFTLKETAGMLGVMSTDLDQSLWRWFGLPTEEPRKYVADF